MLQLDDRSHGLGMQNIHYAKQEWLSDGFGVKAIQKKKKMQKMLRTSKVARLSTSFSDISWAWTCFFLFERRSMASLSGVFRVWKASSYSGLWKAFRRLAGAYRRALSSGQLAPLPQLHSMKCLQSMVLHDFFFNCYNDVSSEFDEFAVDIHLCKLRTTSIARF